MKAAGATGTDTLEWIASAVLTASGYVGVGPWLALLVAGACILYLAQRRNHAPWLSHLQSVRLKPGDRLLARLPANLPMSELDAAKARLEREFKGTQVVVVPDSMDIGVVGPDDAK